MLRIFILGLLVSSVPTQAAAPTIMCTATDATIGNVNVTGNVNIQGGAISIAGVPINFQKDVTGIGEGECNLAGGQFVYGVADSGALHCANPLVGGTFVQLQTTPPATEIGSFAVSGQGWVANLQLGGASGHTLSPAGGQNLDLSGTNIGFNYSTGGSPEVRLYGGTTSTQAALSPLGKIGAYGAPAVFGIPPDFNCPASSGWDCGVRTWDVWADASVRTHQLCVVGAPGPTTNVGSCITSWDDVRALLPKVPAKSCPSLPQQLVASIDSSGNISCQDPGIVATGVSSLNGLAGALVLAGSNGISVPPPVGNTITLTGPGPGPFLTLYPGSPSLANTRQSGNFWISQGALANYTPASLSSTDVLQAKADPAGTATALYAEQNNPGAWTGSFSGDVLIRNPANNAELCLNGTSGAACRSSWPAEGTWPSGPFCILPLAGSSCPTTGGPWTETLITVSGGSQGNIVTASTTGSGLAAKGQATGSSGTWTQDTDADFNTPGSVTANTVVSGGNVNLATVPPEIAPTPNTKALWHFNEGSGSTAADASGNGNTGTLTNGPAWTSSANAKLGASALWFDGADDYVDMGDVLDFTPLQSFTITSWINHDDPGSVFERIVAKQSSGALPQRGYHLGVENGSNKIRASVDDGASFVLKYSSDPLPSGAWTHVAMVVDQSVQTLQLYVGGIPQGSPVSIAAVGDSSNSYPLRIGSASFGAGFGFFDGRIDEVSIWNTPLSAGTIAGMMGYPPSGTYTSAVHDMGAPSDLTSISWQALVPAGTELKFQVGAASSSGGPDTWTVLPENPAGAPRMGGLSFVPPGPFCADSEGCLFNLKGDYTRIFYRYDIGAATWTKLANIPFDIGEGGASAYDNAGRLFALIGGGSNKFIRFDIGSGTWDTDPPADLPVGENVFGVANHLVFVSSGGDCPDPSGCFFALRGDNTPDFWRYRISANAWDPRANFPDPGLGFAGALAYGANGYLYATAEDSQGVFRYRIASDVWDPAATFFLPLTKYQVERTTLTFVPTGADCVDTVGCLFTLPYRDFNEFYRYDLSKAPAGSWVRLADIPFSPGPGRTAAYDRKGRIFAMQGSGTGNLWRYNITGIGALTLYGPGCSTTTYYTSSPSSLAAEPCFQNKQYVQYRAYLSTSDPSQTPALDKVTITYGTTTLYLKFCCKL